MRQVQASGTDRDVWLTKATDGTLLAKIWEYDVEIATLLTPPYGKRYVWARFRPIGE